ncbi:uncharacterized protein PHALS_10269 [Plasmopara halstedii]|uniref:Uncharacterized protein n=1 Tax=Plasmopara halstedii TaxID=4781 RepID=A0A0P1AG27_PLAHL|nr:uncharacterized protein PHALS_10269 [Plasmopara halstedii]CEG40047.1 hypothetical protein PHALS_10269 [Plasmopara halstedii]|eukprot:XP_024576416.1 hypothetical protein PHALS_10269 [Plasmopara halstedii]
MEMTERKKAVQANIKGSSSDASSEEVSNTKKKPLRQTLREFRCSARDLKAWEHEGNVKKSVAEEELQHENQCLSTIKKIETRENKTILETIAHAKLKQSGLKSRNYLKQMSSPRSDISEVIKFNDIQTVLETNEMVQDPDEVKLIAGESFRENIRRLNTDKKGWLQDQKKKRTPKTRRRDGTVENRDDEWHENDWETASLLTEVENDEEVGTADVTQAKYVLRNITSRVSLIEETAIRRGIKLSGPPLEYATTHLDEYARKFRWPQHVRNLRNSDCLQDVSQILEDHEVLTEILQPRPDHREHGMLKECPLAQVPCPLVALSAKALQRVSCKRKRAKNSESKTECTISAATLLNATRVGCKFGDHFIESLLTANGKALQGSEDYDLSYDNRCWSSLPTKKKPIANWRFVLEHWRKTMGRSSGDIAQCPLMQQATFKRITKRLKKLYGFTTQHEEHNVFADYTQSG